MIGRSGGPLLKKAKKKPRGGRSDHGTRKREEEKDRKGEGEGTGMILVRLL